MKNLDNPIDVEPVNIDTSENDIVSSESSKSSEIEDPWEHLIIIFLE